MTIDFTCQKCEGSFEIDARDLIDGSEKLVCPHCEAKAPANMVEDFSSALAELISQVATLSKKFAVTMAVETEDVEEEGEEEEEEEGEDGEEELEFDEEDGEDDDEEEDVEDEDQER